MLVALFFLHSGYLFSFSGKICGEKSFLAAYSAYLLDLANFSLCLSIGPPSLFGLIEKLGFGVESFLFGFLVGGIASVIYEFFQNERVVPLTRRELRKNFFAYAVVAFQSRR